MASFAESSRTAHDDRAPAGLCSPGARLALQRRYLHVRRMTRELCVPLTAEDYGLQAMPDASPPRWHLAHTTWFFETFLLKPFARNYTLFHPSFEYLFNSYYNAVCEQFPRTHRGLLSRPTTEEVLRYRAHVDAAMEALLAQASGEHFDEILRRATLGCHHEEQHQELLLTDIKYSLSVNPLRPAYHAELPDAPPAEDLPLLWVEYAGGLREIGHAGDEFAFDNETPRHAVYVRPFALASRLVTCGEYLAFMDDGGYQRSALWLADGWRTASTNDWRAPLYWERIDGVWWQYTLAGMRRVDEREPVCHVSYYEADAYARYAGLRLPTEAEWEVAAVAQPVAGNLRERGHLHPLAAQTGEAPVQLYGDAWEWTQSAYSAYPGFRAPLGALGEYNGKFMANQMVLRGGSCVTPGAHIRASYRNFFYPPDRWQFSGIRLADDE